MFNAGLDDLSREALSNFDCFRHTAAFGDQPPDIRARRDINARLDSFNVKSDERFTATIEFDPRA